MIGDSEEGCDLGVARDALIDVTVRHLLTAKPVMYIANVAEGSPADNPLVARVKDFAEKHGAEWVVISAALEAELAQLPQAERADFLSSLGLESFPKTSGSKGLQVYVPLNRAEATYDETKPLANALARHLEGEHPELIVSSQKKELRKGKVLIDWSQNDRAKTTVAVYSLRCRDRPWASTPLLWEELEELADDGDPDSVRFEAEQVLERVAAHGDLFAPVLELRQRLPDERPSD